MGRKKCKKQRQQQQQRSTAWSGAATAYEESPKENDQFERYYKLQGIVPEDEWDAFMHSLRQALPLAFRLVGYRNKSQLLSARMLSDYFEGDTPAACPRPQPVQWYPGQIAWQHAISRAEIRSNPALAKYHQFLLGEAECGNVVRQELVSMIPPLLLDVQPEHAVLDMCASPGSKTHQLIELLHRDSLTPPGVVVANDSSNPRCYTMTHNLKRHASPCLVVTNHNGVIFPNIHLPIPVAAAAASAADPQPPLLVYDRVLCDVPCTGDATLRKNLAIWRRWQCKNANSLHRLQLAILKRALHLLKVGGRLVYSTCSFNPVENEAVIAAALTHFGEDNLRIEDVSACLPGLKRCAGVRSWKVCVDESARSEFESYAQFKSSDCPPHIKLQPTLFPPVSSTLNLDRCVRILPHHNDSGGFFVAVLTKLHHFSARKNAAAARAADSTCEAAAANARQSQGEGRDGDGNEDTGDDECTAGEDVQAAEELEGAEGLSFESGAGPPPAKAGRFVGFKEDPFVFITEEEGGAAVETLKHHFGAAHSLRLDLLLKRQSCGPGKRLYMTSERVKHIVENNDNSRVKIIHAGTMVLERRPMDGSELQYRLVQDGLPLILPHLTKRVLPVSNGQMKELLIEEAIVFDKLEPECRLQLQHISVGSLVLQLTPPTEQPGGGGGGTFAICAWKGNQALRIYVKDAERRHFLRVCGVNPDSELPAPKLPTIHHNDTADKINSNS